MVGFIITGFPLNFNQTFIDIIIAGLIAFHVGGLLSAQRRYVLDIDPDCISRDHVHTSSTRFLWQPDNPVHPAGVNPLTRKTGSWQLPKTDMVLFRWGVLHHTGHMYPAIEAGFGTG